MRFKGKIVWVTGTSSGLGEVLTKAFHQAGANLAISGRRRNELERVRAECIKERVSSGVSVPLSKILFLTLNSPIPEVL